MKENTNKLETLNKFTDYFSQMADQFQESEDLNHLREMKSMMDEMIIFLREEYQSKTSDEAKRVIESMPSNPNSEKVELLENYIIGDAKAYLEESKENYQEWKKILGEYSKQIENIDTNPKDIEYMLSLIGKAKVLRNALIDMSYYLEEKGRVDAFRKAIEDGIDSKEASFYKSILKYKLNSSKA
ncbi:MAG: hypothetical protein SFU25_00235 [Candidatus Caenarcaniphilales bacterium]|nr:hypothetical protein [Candidatus Caenarcaniphilales bacterium]